MSELAARGIVVARNGTRILDGASLTVRANEAAALGGASGSGKTTLLRILAGLTEPDAGQVLLDGEDTRAMRPRALRQKVAYVPQQPPMLEGTVRDNVAAGPQLRGEPLDDARVAELLARVGLEARFAERAARDLSGGEKQRVALARALANDPRVLLLDEPTAALDPAAATRVLDLVKDLAAGGLAVLVVTHVEEHARALGGPRYALHGGTVA